MNNQILFNVLVIAILVGVIFYMYYTKRKKELKQIIYDLVCEAEKKFIDEPKSGGKKYSYVADVIMPFVNQTFLKYILSEDTVDLYIEQAVDVLKKKLIEDVATNSQISNTDKNITQSESLNDDTNTTE